jgi:hypothetical protein
MTDDRHKTDEGQGLGEADLAEDLEIRDAEAADAVKGGSADGENGAPAQGVKLNHSERVLP